MRTPLTYYGGKQRLAHQIIPLMPPHRVYLEALLTAHWQRCRERAFSHYGQTCVLCGAVSRLQVHHRTYANLGAEHIEDLIVLCDACHARQHRKTG